MPYIIAMLALAIMIIGLVTLVVALIDFTKMLGEREWPAGSGSPSPAAPAATDSTLSNPPS